MGRATEFVVPLSHRRIEAALTFGVVITVVEIVLLIDLYVAPVVPLYSALSRLVALFVGGAIASILASRAYRSPRDRVVAGPESLTLYRADGFVEEIPVGQVAQVKFGWIYRSPRARRSVPGSRITLDNGLEYALPGILHDVGTGTDFGSYLTSRFPDRTEGVPAASSPTLASFAIALMVLTLGLLLIPIFMRSMGHELLAIPVATDDARTPSRFNQSDVLRGLRFTALLPLPHGEIVAGTERQGAWRFDATGRARKLGRVRGYIISLAALPDERVAVAWANSRKDHFDHVEVGVFEGNGIANEYRVSRDLRFPTQIVWHPPCLYLASAEGLLCLSADGKLSTVIEGWCSNLQPQADGSLVVYHSIAERRRLLRLTTTNTVQTLVDIEHCPAQFAFDQENRLWGFQVQGQGHIDPPDGPELPKLPYLVKDVVATPGRMWVKLTELKSGDYGLGFWSTETMEFRLVLEPSGPGDPALLEHGHGTLWVAGRGTFAIPEVGSPSPPFD